MVKVLSSFSLLLFPAVLFSEILHVGSSYPYPTLSAALDAVSPGDTIQVHQGTYPGGLYEENVQGTAEAWITIEAVPGDVVIFDGGSNAWQFTDAAYLDIRGFIFQHQTGNGLNFDDGGTYDSPAHHIRFTDCLFRDMSATGNNDFLKLSGLDSFEVKSCTFLNGAAGGSGIDMVGCHDGWVSQCHFQFLGSNSIQMKGGTRNIVVERNFFKNGGQRALNMGGSTDLQFFRPLDAPYEAADLKVYANVFIGSLAPVAFVGCIHSEVINNTIYLPDKWVLRILQETVDTTRFAPCGQNSFVNNIMYIDNRVNTVCNIGPNTDPSSFTFSNNFWFHSQDNSWTGPDLPAEDLNSIVGEDPLFRDQDQDDFSLLPGSLAIAAGKEVPQPVADYTGNTFSHPRSIGAYEGNPVTGTADLKKEESLHIQVFPNPAADNFTIILPKIIHDQLTIALINTAGQVVRKFAISDPALNKINVETKKLMQGLYYVVVTGPSHIYKTTIFLH